MALQVRHGRTVVVNVRRGGPHRHLVPWLLDHGMIGYVGHGGSRLSWPWSDFVNPFVKQARHGTGGYSNHFSRAADVM